MIDESTQPPWWLVPNLLALDAPIVAAVWQRFLGDAYGVVVPWAATLALGSIVWCIYLADRVLDARRGAVEADRHQFADRYRMAFMTSCLVAGVLAGTAALQLPADYLRLGAVLFLGVLGYLIVVHRFAGGFGPVRGVKEGLVAIGFSAGVTIPLAISDSVVDGWLAGAMAFGALCWINCRLIDGWERRDRMRSWWPEVALGIAVVLTCVALPINVGLAVGGAAIGLFAVHHGCQNRPRAGRVLADVVLLTPLLVGIST